MGRCHIFFLLVLVLADISSQDRTEEHRRKGVSKKYCGMYLTRELSIVCHGNYNALKLYRKRSVDDNLVLAKGKSDNTLESFDNEYPFLTKETAQSFTTTKQFRRRLVRGVVNECCDKPCSYDELRSYCASDEDESQ